MFEKHLLPLLSNLIETVIRVLTTYENRITSYIVLTGIALSATPLWETVLAAFLHRYLDLRIDLSSLPYVGVSLIAIALCFRLAWEWRPQKRIDANLKHDARVAERLKDSLSYNKIDGLIYNLENNHAYFRDEGWQLENIVRFFDDARNNFIDPQTSKAAEDLADSASRLADFLGYNFFIHPDGQAGENLRFRMHPALNWDTGNPTPEQTARYVL